jgi:hypothetical protein
MPTPPSNRQYSISEADFEKQNSGSGPVNFRSPDVAGHDDLRARQARNLTAVPQPPRDENLRAAGQFMSQMQQQVPQGIASLSNMRYGDSQRQQAFGNEQQRLLNQMNRFDGRFRGR